MDKFFPIIRGFGSLIGAAVVFMFGKMDQLLYTLLAFIIIDYATGIIKATIEKKLNSMIGFKGIAKKVLILLLVAAGNLTDKITGSGGVIRSVVCMFFLCNEALSIIENAALMGVPFPKKIKKILEQLKEDNDKEDDDNGCSDNL